MKKILLTLQLPDPALLQPGGMHRFDHSKTDFHLPEQCGAQGLLLLALCYTSPADPVTDPSGTGGKTKPTGPAGSLVLSAQGLLLQALCNASPADPVVDPSSSVRKANPPRLVGGLALSVNQQLFLRKDQFFVPVLIQVMVTETAGSLSSE